MITTFEEACEFVLENKVCTIFGSRGSPYPSLWDNVGLSEEKPKEGGWSPKVIAVWTWKNKIPNTFPDEFFYGKVAGGDAVLMALDHLRSVYYPQAFQPISELDQLSKGIYEYVKIEPYFTGDLRKLAMVDFGCTKSRFDTALKKLQISLNIVRSNDPALTKDQWLTFGELYPEIVERYS